MEFFRLLVKQDAEGPAALTADAAFGRDANPNCGSDQMSYIDGFVIAVPSANREKFIEHANSVDTIFTEMGATRVVECWADDLSEGKLTDFRKAVQAKEDETVVFSWIEWPDKQTRDAAMKAMMSEDFKDERMDPEKNPMPFDGMRLIYGGFERIVEL